MRTDDFDYHLPPELIAQTPALSRSGARMLVVSRETGACRAGVFSEIVGLFKAGDVLVLNNTSVIHARLFGRKEGREDGAKTEFLLLSPQNPEFTVWEAYAKPAKRIPPGTRVRLTGHDGAFTGTDDWVEILERNPDGSLRIRLCTQGNVFDFLEKHGNLPLPPYITRKPDESDEERYQTVYARTPGAVAAPTAGLHFTDEILDALRAKGVYVTFVTLHTGAGTFKPVTVDEVESHVMHAETFQVPPETAEIVNCAKREKRRVIAVGTTTVRTLESVSDDDGMIHAASGSTQIFLYPPYRPKVADALLTNFHLPKSTLMMLVSTFSTREKILDAYRFAVAEKFRFYSYGDCMFLI